MFPSGKKKTLGGKDRQQISKCPIELRTIQEKRTRTEQTERPKGKGDSPPLRRDGEEKNSATTTKDIVATHFGGGKGLPPICATTEKGNGSLKLIRGPNKNY